MQNFMYAKLYVCKTLCMQNFMYAKLYVCKTLKIHLYTNIYKN